MNLIQKISLFFELRSFGVSAWFARKMRVEVSRVRLFFIYFWSKETYYRKVIFFSQLWALCSCLLLNIKIKVIYNLKEVAMSDSSVVELTKYVNSALQLIVPT